jgi:para-aminobenzoate synthetase component 1
MSEACPPVVEELAPAPSVLQAVRSLAGWPYLVLFDSALPRSGSGRYSFLTADPCRYWERESVSFGDRPFDDIRRALADCRTLPVPGLPPFQGGAAGLLGYDLGHAWERLPRPPWNEFPTPALAVGLYDWVIAWDHLQQRAWIISQGGPELLPDRRQRRARERLENVRRQLQAPAGHLSEEWRVPSSPTPAPAGAVHHSLQSRPWLTSNFSRSGYLDTVARALEYIRAGDIFQVNLSQRLLAPLQVPVLDLYDRLRQRNPAPFAGLLAGRGWIVASASPERFLTVRDQVVETFPIKGTRQRRSGPEADLYTRDELRESAKDLAENIMIVDLLRNDLSKVCRPGSIQATDLCRVETYETVQHLVSTVRGELPADRDAWDVLAATFPGGSITGAPKVRAMEIIAELEPTARGPYCGSLFYVGYDGRMDSNILIRTFTIQQGWVQCPVGGGIVARSIPAIEYDETWHKADGMLRAL